MTVAIASAVKYAERHHLAPTSAQAAPDRCRSNKTVIDDEKDERA
jgi:hypothetical protein